MKKTLVLLLLTIAITNIQGQRSRQVDQLATLGKVWGFLKYYHPSAAKGQPDWDSALLRMIPLAEAAKDSKAFDELLQNWYRSLPAAKLASSPLVWNSDSVDRVFTERDIEGFNIPRDLRLQFLDLYRYHLPDSSRYITRYYRKHYFDHIIHTEDPHESPAYPDRPMRLLALFRYWNTIEYFYPHKNRIDNWNAVLKKHIVPFLQARDSAQYQLAVSELIHELPDSHSFLASDRIQFVAPFRIDYIDGRYLIGECNDSAMRRGDFQLGDEIIAINGRPVREREAELLETTTGTNYLSLHRNIAQGLLMVGDSNVKVSFKRDGRIIAKRVELHTWQVARQLPRPPAKPLWEELESGIWYVRFCRISDPDTLRHLFRDIRNARAVIWEMRDYPNYKVTTALNKFLFHDPIVLTEERNASDLYPGVFTRISSSFNPAGKEELVYPGPLVVLVDEHTQSLSESVAAMLRLRSNTITMGRQTAGTTGNVTWISLPGGLGVSYTGVGVSGAQEGFRQGEGVKIDVPITLSMERIKNGRDFILEEAIRYARMK